MSIQAGEGLPVTTLLLLAFVAALAARALGRQGGGLKQLLLFHPVPPREVVSTLLLLVVAALFTALMWASLDSQLRVVVPSILDTHWTVFLVIACICGPTFEEIIFRGYLLSFFRSQNDGFVVPTVMTSVVFSVLHSYQSLPSSFMVSVWLCSIKFRTDSLVMCAIAHGLFNACIYLLDRALTPIRVNQILDSTSTAFLAAAAAAIYALFAYRIHQKHRLPGS